MQRHAIPNTELESDSDLDAVLGPILVICCLVGNALLGTILMSEGAQIEFWGYIQHIGTGIFFTIFNAAGVAGVRRIWSAYFG